MIPGEWKIWAGLVLLLLAGPAVYLQDVPEPELRGKTNGDLAAWALELREAVRMGNSDKAALREWVEGGGNQRRLFFSE